jgi:ABC-type lipoprotein release transport system permease subunit
VHPAEPLTYIAVAVAVSLVALFASFVPARRAMSADPMTSLRCE